MIFVGGRKVKIATGQKSQTVNVYTARGHRGEYDYVLRLEPPAVSEAAIRERAFVEVGELVQFLQHEYKASVEREPKLPGSVPTADTPPTTQGDLVGRAYAVARSHPVLAVVVLTASVVVALAKFTDALTTLASFMTRTIG